MDEYTPLDLKAFYNAGLALLGEQGTASIGPQQFERPRVGTGRFGKTGHASQQVGARGVEPAVGLERASDFRSIQQRQPARRAGGHRNGGSAIELDHR